MPAGYSERPLVEKLGIKPGARFALVHAPTQYSRTLGRLPPGAAPCEQLDAPLVFIQVFATKRATLEREFPRLRRALEPRGMLWVSWPKGSSNLATDLNEKIVREVGLSNGMVDVKVCAVDETWSGLKFVFRIKARG